MDLTLSNLIKLRQQIIKFDQTLIGFNQHLTAIENSIIDIQETTGESIDINPVAFNCQKCSFKVLEGSEIQVESYTLNGGGDWYCPTCYANPQNEEEIHGLLDERGSLAGTGKYRDIERDFELGMIFYNHYKYKQKKICRLIIN